MTDLNTLVLIHAGGIIHGQQHLILPLTRLGPPQPDPVILKVAGDVWDDSPHVQPLPTAEVAPKGRKQLVKLVRYDIHAQRWRRESYLSWAALVGNSIRRSSSKSACDSPMVRLSYFNHKSEALSSYREKR